ncbi:MAG: ribosomal protein S18-alanine N-acetyltransferase [Actinomycetota bacterium]|nr:ribosomal protein S18-alanine N-acetyltransferase [Actinomycetota bacterium]
MTVVQLERMRWWHLDKVARIELELFGADRWSAEMFWSELAEQPTRHYVVAADPAGDVVGYAGLCVYSHEAYIQTMAVHPDRQSGGIGGLLLQALLDEADRRAAYSVGLEVRADNAGAQRLYAAHGFEAVARRRHYYQPSGADAVVMLRRTSPVRADW